MININKVIKKYKYKVYGLIIESEFQLQELYKVEDVNEEVDVNISYGKTPKDIAKELDASELRTKCCPISRGDIWVTVNEIANYNILNGDTIIVDPKEGVDFSRVKAFLLGWCFGILFTQRNIIAIHGSGILVGDKGVIIAGESGAGKSTLAEAFKIKGNSFVTDDVAVIDVNDSLYPKIKPAYSTKKLSKDVMDYFGYDIEKYKRNKKNDDRKRFIVPCDDKFINKEIPLNAVFILAVEDVEDIKVSELKGKEKIDSLMKNGYFLKVEAIQGMRPEYFKQYLNLAQKVKVYRLIRPNNGFTVEKQMEAILNLCN